jgi:hypothetical protein
VRRQDSPACQGDLAAGGASRDVRCWPWAAGLGAAHTEWVEPAAAGELWDRAAARIGSALGWRLRCLGRMGRVHGDRCTWLAQAEPGQVVVKAKAHGLTAEWAAWAGVALPVLAGRGYPVPEIIWHGPLDERWFVVVQGKLPGAPLELRGGRPAGAVRAARRAAPGTHMGPGRRRGTGIAHSRTSRLTCPRFRIPPACGLGAV